jgi:hypothetical protein
MKRSRDEDIRIRQMLVKFTILSVLVMSYDISMALRFKPLANTQLVFNATFSKTVSLTNAWDLYFYACTYRVIPVVP